MMKIKESYRITVVEHEFVTSNLRLFVYIVEEEGGRSKLVDDLGQLRWFRERIIKGSRTRLNNLFKIIWLTTVL